MSEAVGVVKPKLAASVILVRSPMRVYMTRRSDALRFAGGYHVFPGGAVDPQDEDLAARHPAQLQALGLPPGHAACVAAALRELFEEAGILLARDAAGVPLWMPEGAHAHRETLKIVRRRLLADEVSFEDVVTELGWRLAGDRLAYVGRWVTPPAAARRFDTLFFLADGTGGIEPSPSGGEVAHGEWVAPAVALKREQAGEMLLMRPTRSWLRALAECHSTAEAWERLSGPAACQQAVYETNTPDVLRSVLEAHGVWPVPVPSPTLLPATETNVYLVARSGEALLVDAGHGGPNGVALVRAAWMRAGRPRVQGIVLTHTHRDHAGGVAELAAEFQCPVLSYSADSGDQQPGPPGSVDGGWPAGVEHRPIGADTVLAVGPLQLHVLHTPGHAPDHVCLFAPGPGILFSGDNVVGEGSTWVGPPHGDMQVYLQSLACMARLPARIIAPGHGPLLDDPPHRIRTLIQRRLEREAQILALIREAPRTAAALADALYRETVPPSVMEMAQRTVVGHLIKLEREGRVRRLPDDPDRFAPAEP